MDGTCPNCGYCPHCKRSSPHYPYITLGDFKYYQQGTATVPAINLAYSTGAQYDAYKDFKP